MKTGYRSLALSGALLAGCASSGWKSYPAETDPNMYLGRPLRVEKVDGIRGTPLSDPKAEKYIAEITAEIPGRNRVARFSVELTRDEKEMLADVLEAGRWLQFDFRAGALNGRDVPGTIYPVTRAADWDTVGDRTFLYASAIRDVTPGQTTLTRDPETSNDKASLAQSQTSFGALGDDQKAAPAAAPAGPGIPAPSASPAPAGQPAQSTQPPQPAPAPGIKP